MVTTSTLPSRRILSPADCAEYHRNGFLTVHGAWDQAAVMEVRCLIDGLYKAAGRESGPLPNLMWQAPQLWNTVLFRSCRAIAKQLLGMTTRYACDNALYKEPHGIHGTPWHQDGAFHGRYFPNNTLAFWIPLQDVTPENGCMQYIPLQPYQILLPHRPYYPNDQKSMMTDHADSSLAVVCPLRAGDALVHGPLTLHAASSNQTDDVRRTWLLTFRPWGKWGALAPSRMVQRARLIRNALVHRRQ